MLAIGLAMGASLWSGPQAPFPAFLRWAMAAAIFLLAGLVGPPAILSFGRAKTTIDPVHIDRASALVTTGVYRFTRNPMYVSMALLLCAWAICLARPLAALGPIAYVLYITRFQIIPEERALAAQFGEEYSTYRKKTRRWL
jgi:protein-S-isoprenylcysteine O-methyltransferase Ste14